MMSDPASILLCEPQCWGFEHSSVNAALLTALASACPDHRLVFLGEGSHIHSVRGVLKARSRVNGARVQWREIAIPPRMRGGWARLKEEWNCCRATLELASATNASALVLSSTTAKGLMALKVFLKRSQRKLPVVALLHAELAGVAGRQPRRPWSWLLAPRQVLRLPRPRNLICVVLSQSIRLELVKALPGAADDFRAIDLPCLLEEAAVPDGHVAGPVRFGFFGVGVQPEKGFREFIRLAEEVAGKPSLRRVEFLSVGFVPETLCAGAHRAGITPVSSLPLSDEEYGGRARSVTYAIGLGSPLHYRLVASASFVDALCYGKPGIYIRNPYIEHYFARMGDIGYLCSSYDEVRETVLAILRSFPEERYRQQCGNILRARQLFDPPVVGAELRSILAEAELRPY
jgi:hypothetical protein